MHLLNARTLTLEHFIGDSIPPYAILSHTWGPEEATFQDYTPLKAYQEERRSRKLTLGLLPRQRRTGQWRSSQRRQRRGPGHAKIYACCRQARKNNLDYVWCDTCCIDKSSSAELSEAINSMFHYYRKAAVCYVFLSDVHPASTGTDATFLGTESEHASQNEDIMLGCRHASDATNTSLELAVLAAQLPEFKQTRWLTRGWTLQELIAPSLLEFFDSSWSMLGWSGDYSRASDEQGPWLTPLLSELTGIPVKFLIGTSLDGASVGSRMKWASKRQTTRTEDLAYCLLGIFNVNMPLLYGEGNSAFERLQQEIIRKYDDHSIFAFGDESTSGKLSKFSWGLNMGRGGLMPLATDAIQFAQIDDSLLSPVGMRGAAHYTTTNRGIQISLPLINLPTGENLVLLDCRTLGPFSKQLCLILNPKPLESMNLYRRDTRSLDYIEFSRWHKLNRVHAPRRQIYITLPPPITIDEVEDSHKIMLVFSSQCGKLFLVKRCYPMLWELGEGRFYADDDVRGVLQTSDSSAIYLECRSLGEEAADFVLRIHRETHRDTNANGTRSTEWSGHLSILHRRGNLSMAEVMLIPEENQGTKEWRNTFPKWEWDPEMAGRRIKLNIEPETGRACLSMETPEQARARTSGV